MALNKLKFNSLNVTPTAGKTVGFNSSANGLEATLSGGAMTFIKKLTASSSGTLSFVDGSSNVVLDNTYKEYLFLFTNIHPSATSAPTMQGSTDTGSSYGVSATTTTFGAYHTESDSATALGYDTGSDVANSTSFFQMNAWQTVGNDNDQNMGGYLHLFNPSSTTFVKHFISRIITGSLGVQPDLYLGGYFNTTSAIDAIQFKMSSGNIDAGTITLYGIN